MKKVLISFFSASGVTKRIAGEIAKAIDGDLFEIEPAVPYTIADLDWKDKESRTSEEMNSNNRSFRPRVVNKVSNLDDYDKVIIGFPVWWYTAPRIINTFIEENDLTGKDIYVFVTSGGSGVDGSFNDLKKTYSDLNFISGKRFQEVNPQVVKEWIFL